MVTVAGDAGSERELRGLAPGVHIRARGRAAEAAFATGRPLFVGFVSGPTANGGDGPAPRLVRLASWADFGSTVGAVRPGSYLGHAVRGFFENGGTDCAVVAVPVRDEPGQPGRTLARALRSVFQPAPHRGDPRGMRGVLDDIDDVDLVCVPDIMIADIRGGPGGPETVRELQQHVLDYCADMGERFAILDVVPGGAPDVVGWMEEQWRHLTSSDGALYGPWLGVRSLDRARPEWVPPCGHVAGIFARTDSRVGVHKAPANEVVDGIVDVEVDLAQHEQARLNDAGVNCLVSAPRRGIRVWGARTLSGHRQWRYVNVRRIFLTLARWARHHLQEAVFEPNDPGLWDRTREQVAGFCYELFQRGALKGATPEDAFFVKCDAEVNRPEDRDEGRLVCEVGLAPLSPAEFILIRITQSAAHGTVVTVRGA